MKQRRDLAASARRALSGRTGHDGSCRAILQALARLRKAHIVDTARPYCCPLCGQVVMPEPEQEEP